MIVMVCPDFPLDLIIDAAEFTQHADTQSHRFLGERSPVASRQGDTRSGSPDGAELVLFPLQGLQQAVEFRFVYSEVFRSVKDFYKRQGLPGDFGVGTVASRISLVRHLRDALFGGAGATQIPLAGAALPSEGALQKLLQGKRGLLEGFTEELSLTEAIREMANCFELTPPPIPATLLLKVAVPTAKVSEPPKEALESTAAAAEESQEREATEVLSATAAAQSPSFAQGAARTSLRLAERQLAPGSKIWRRHCSSKGRSRQSRGWKHWTICRHGLPKAYLPHGSCLLRGFASLLGTETPGLCGFYKRPLERPLWLPGSVGWCFRLWQCARCRQGCASSPRCAGLLQGDARDA
ncbi:Ferredoxin [Symbiodinium sp. CCMP2592]|nr:Ferredoxin [Symbiodinium sp. CCMP2592]